MTKSKIENITKNQFYRDYRFWFALIAIIISVISLIKTTNLNLEFKELKVDIIEAIKIISPNATIENIDGVECILFENGAKWCGNS